MPLPSRSRSRTPRRSITPRSISRSPSRSSLPRRTSRSPVQSRSPRSANRSLPPPQRSAKIVVEKLTKNVSDAHLREIFGVYGELKEVDMPMNRQFNTNRGTAYILFADIASAEQAIAHMHEGQLDGTVINVSIVLPRRKFSQSPPPSRRLTDFRARDRERLDGLPPGQGGPDRGGMGGAGYRERGRDMRGPGGPPRGGRGYDSPPRRRSPSPRGRYDRGGRGRGGRDAGGYGRGRSYTRSRSPRRSPSYSRSRSISRTPPPRRGTGGAAGSSRGGGGDRNHRTRDSPPPRNGRTGGGGEGRRRSPSYSSYSRSRSRSRSRTPPRR